MSSLFDRLNRWAGTAPATPSPAPLPAATGEGPLAQKLRASVVAKLFSSPEAHEKTATLFDTPRLPPRPAEVDPARTFTGFPESIFTQRGENDDAAEESAKGHKDAVQRCPEFVRVVNLPAR